MSRGDLISAGITLIAAAIGWWVGGSRTAVACAALGVVILLIARFVRESSKEVPSLPTVTQDASSEVKDSSNAAVRDSGNASIEQHFHFADNAAQAIRKVAPSEAASGKVKHRPHVQFVRTLSTPIGYDESRDTCHDGGRSAWNGAVALFRNSSLTDGEVDDAEYVRAQIIYKNEKGDEIFNAAPACWLDNYSETVSLDVDVDRGLVMGLVTPDGSLLALRRESGYSSGQSVVRMKYREFGNDENVTTAEVKLVESNRVICGPIVFSVQIVEGRLEIKRQSVP